MTCTSTALLLALVAYQAQLGIAEFPIISTSAMQCDIKDFNVKEIDTGDNCVTEKKKRNIFTIKNSASEVCSTELYATDVPRFMNITISKIKLNEGDMLTYFSSFFNKDLTTASAGDRIYLPFGYLQYGTEEAVKEGKAFKVRIRFQKNRCHKVIFVPVGTKGRITTPGFDSNEMEKNTYCQWWIVSPKDTKIVLEFTGFNVGKGKTQRCMDEDFVAVDRDGNKLYRNKQMLCGNTVPDTKKFTSVANKMNVLVYAPNEDLKSKGINATYEAIKG